MSIAEGVTAGISSGKVKNCLDDFYFQPGRGFPTFPFIYLTVAGGTNGGTKHIDNNYWRESSRYGV
jgi:hypothetical protein